ncbi:MAG: hypothetical protein KA436_04365 [Oligoflexales bacterium]|nr:hypothetical protein [Oligoflexales bacterium]
MSCRSNSSFSDGPWEGGWAITSAGDLCTDGQGKIFSFNNKSEYAQPIISISNFFAFLGLRGLVLAWELGRGNPEEEESPQFGLGGWKGAVGARQDADLAAKRVDIKRRVGAIHRREVASRPAPGNARESPGDMPRGRRAEVAEKQARARRAKAKKAATKQGVVERAGLKGRIAEDQAELARLLAKQPRKGQGAAPRAEADAEARARQEALSAPRVSPQNKQAALDEAMTDVESMGGLSNLFYLVVDVDGHRIPISRTRVRIIFYLIPF